ncbi:MAG TPA: signal peptide peptidase SppA [Prolixibacteraceae bacterium]|nr:signal peptide peptidase SppA [Prolixibacteraceae bacterium]
MRFFWKAFFASLAAIVVATILFLFLLAGFIASLASMGDQSISVKENSLLILKLDNRIVERKSNNPFEDIELPGMELSGTTGLNQIFHAIKQAKNDPKIKGIYLELSEIEAGFATAEEIRNALIDFKSSGKFIYSYSDAISQKAYYLASVADSLMLNPVGMFDFRGLNADHTFFKKALDKFGIEMQIVRGKDNKFKSAVEQFMYDKMSPASKEQTTIYLAAIWNHLLKGISESRKISVDSLNAYANSVMTFRTAEAAQKNRFFDRLKYRDQVLADLRILAGLKVNAEIPVLTVSEYDKIPDITRTLVKDRIAVVYAEGEIDTGSESSAHDINSKDVSEGIREARIDTAVKAIVLRVNSPGGSAFGSEVIWREVKLAQEVKPVIVSMGDYAASGGYYIAAPATMIIADPTTITGSIGVFGTIPNFGELLNNKIGITFDNVMTNEHADMPSFTRKMTPFEANLMQSYVENTYDIFVSHVAEGRNLSVENVDSLGQGRVWCGLNARDNHLIDEFGGLKDAIKIAAEKAGIDEYRIKELPKQKDPFAELLKNFSVSMQTRVMESVLGSSFNYWKNLSREANSKGIYTRMPFNLEIN